MSTSRLSPTFEVESTQYVDVQANWLGTNLSDAVGGSFLAPIQWNGPIGLINWVMRFTTVPSSGTSGVFKLVVPELVGFPDQYLGYAIRAGVMTSALLNATGITTTVSLTSNQQICLRGMLTAEALNY